MRWMVWLGAAASAAFGIGCLVLLFVLRLSLFERVTFLFVAGAAPFLGRDHLRQLLHSKPALRLDSHGVQGAFGQVVWGSVARISVETKWDSAGYLQPKLILHLRHPVRPSRPARSLWASEWIYAEGHVTSHEVQLQLWRSSKGVRADLRRFYEGPID